MNNKIKYNPNIHHRKSIRLKGFDYSKAGLYFITVCVQNRKCLFGKIDLEEMELNDAGKMLKKWYIELENKFPEIRCHELIIMPNHFHCILEIVVGADLCLPNTSNTIRSNIEGEHIGSPLHRVIQWFKTMTTNEYIRGVKALDWQPFDGKLWQRNYYEHIIRNEQSYHILSEYIIINPANWANDKFYII